METLKKIIERSAGIDHCVRIENNSNKDIISNNVKIIKNECKNIGRFNRGNYNIYIEDFHNRNNRLLTIPLYINKSIWITINEDGTYKIE